MRWLLTCTRSGAFSWHETEAAARCAAWGLKDYEIASEAIA